MPASGRPILVVEDDAAIRSALEFGLEADGLPVRLAADGREGIELIQEQRPSLVFLDMQMPVLDGWGFHQELVARGFDPPVVVMTTEDAAPRIAEQLGAAGFVGKPFSLQQIRDAVNQHRIP